MERDSAGASVPGSQQHLAATMEKDSAGASVRDSQRRLQTPPNAACHRSDAPGKAGFTSAKATFDLACQIRQGPVQVKNACGSMQ